MTKRLFGLAFVLLVAPAYAQDFATSFVSEEISPGIHVLVGAEGKLGGGTVTVLVGDEHVLLIDDALPPTSPALIDAVYELAGRKVDFVINTHVHGDHTGGNAQLASDGTLVVAHDNIRTRLLSKPEDAGGEAGIPVLTFSDTVTFHVNGHTAHVIHLENAHTDGDGVIHFAEANVIHAGDNFFHHVFPYIDLDQGGSVDGYIAAQRKLIAMADEESKIVAGHGAPVATKADLQRDMAMLIESHERVKALVAKGMSRDEVLAANPLGSYADEYDWGFINSERMTITLYRDLTE